MNIDGYKDLRRHWTHNIVCVLYGNNENVALECTTCNEVLIDYNNDRSENRVPFESFLDWLDRVSPKEVKLKK